MTEVLADRYELGARLGVGGMSTVRTAFDRTLEREVAVKLLAEHLADDAQFVSRFRREALAAARLVHPNVVQVFDFGLDDATARHYIVMERIDGQSGAEILRERGHLPVAEALDIVTQACRGLDYAHRGGVVHRDVKPGNLLRAKDGTVKLADFGIAAVGGESSITQVGSVLGTASYLAPEQAAGEEAGPQSDIYALGVVTYQFLTGRLPYEARSLTELALKQQREAPAYAHELVDGIPPELSRAIDRALALDPRGRYATPDDFAEALREGARGIAPTEGATTVAPPATTVTPHAGDPPTAERAAARQPRSPRQPRVSPPIDAAAAAPAAPARAADRGRRKGRARRTVALLIAALLVGTGVGVAYVATQDDSTSVNIRNTVYDQVDRSLEELRKLVEDNTR